MAADDELTGAPPSWGLRNAHALGLTGEAAEEHARQLEADEQEAGVVTDRSCSPVLTEAEYAESVRLAQEHDRRFRPEHGSITLALTARVRDATRPAPRSRDSRPRRTSANGSRSNGSRGSPARPAGEEDDDLGAAAFRALAHEQRRNVGAHMRRKATAA